MTHKLRILMAQFNAKVGAISSNAARICQLIQTYQDSHDLIIFPELALSGYPPEDLLLRKSFHQKIEKALTEIAQLIDKCHVVIGHPSFIAGKCYNSASVYHQHQRVALYHKQALPNYAVFDEMRYFNPGEKNPTIFEIQGHRLGLCICEDLWTDYPVENLIQAGIDSLLCLNASPFDYTKQKQRETLACRYANRGCSLIYVNTVGGQDELVFDGQSFAMDPQGKIVARAKAFCQDNLSLILDKNKIEGSLTPLLNEDAAIYQALVFGTREYVEKNGFPGIILGLSGGIDSALTLAIAVDALGSQRVQALLLPSRYTAEISLLDAEEQLKILGVKGQILSIEPAFKVLLETLDPCFQDSGTIAHTPDTTEENIQARIRGLLLMALSNKTGSMVLTTSNKSESSVGYATLYGDMAGGFAVLKDVLKTQVYALAAYRNRLSFVIPERVITRAPSAELKLNQTDQDNLPDYTVLDGIIQLYIEENLSREEIIKQGFLPQVVDKVVNLIKVSEYKRRQAPPGIKVSPRAFGRDWRQPITSGFIEA